MRSPSRKTYMKLAIEQARKGIGKTDPNPVVGCVIIKDNRIIAKGYHKEFGGPHAEVIALKKAGKKAKGASLYLSLEPCAYFGKTPACTEAIINAGIKEVICAVKDPNPQNNGRGFKRLREKKIKVITGIMKKEAEALNSGFIKRMKQRQPLITLKLAQSLDGKIATHTGDSKWISDKPSRKIVQKLRSQHDAIMIGVQTLLNDNPRLSLRNSNGLAKRQPVRVIIDSMLKTPLTAKIFKSRPMARIIIAASDKASRHKEERLKKAGAQVLRVGSDSKGLNLHSLTRKLASIGITSILVEGGGELSASLLADKLVNKLYLFIAPILIGGKDAITSYEGQGVKRIRDAISLNGYKIERSGRDILIESHVYRNN